MPVVLFTDFGASDLYVGQVKAVIGTHAPRAQVLDALHAAPNFGIEPSAHLLAALAPEYPRGSVFLAVVDPGVGGPRDAIVVEADGRSFVGPDNGLLSLVWQRAIRRRCRRIVWRPERLSDTFHGRDLFAPVAARLSARTRLPRGWLVAKRRPDVVFDARDLAAIIYVDHYGNALTGLRSAMLPRSAILRVGGRSVRHARTFEEAGRGGVFWHSNSLGLVEIAANRASAALALGLEAGSRIRIAAR
jgi:S-adenosylmethionine hydrolase